MPQRIQYPSDVTDRQWQEIGSLLPSGRDCGRDRSTDLREVVNGINYRWKTGCVWRMLPHDFPPWPTIYTYFQRWQRDGTLKYIRETLLRRQPRRRFSRRTHPVNKVQSRNTEAEYFHTLER